VPISLGTPSLHLTALLDTSWSPFFVPSANCTSNQESFYSCIIHPLYNSSLSSTYTPDLSPCKLTYLGFESVRTRGAISTDTLHVAGMSIAHQAFEEATTWQPGMLSADEYFDTVLGLALHPTYDSWGNFSAPGPFQNMLQQRLLNEDLFSLTLPMRENEPGEIVFGGLPENVARDDLLEVPLNTTRVGEGDEFWDFYTSGGWQVEVSNISMTSPSPSSSEPLVILQAPHIAIVTTSYPYIGLPSAAAKRARELIGLSDGATWLDCASRSSLPDLVFDFGTGKQLRLTARDYLLEVWDDICRKTKCVDAFNDVGDGGGVLLGYPFLTGLVSVWDAGRGSMGFAKRVG
jgi:hypothetical protein